MKSKDFGNYLVELRKNKDMSQKELAIRTGMSEKHISTVISGKKNISSSFLYINITFLGLNFLVASILNSLCLST